MEKIHWGILGTGRIANNFAIGLSSLPDAELVAVGSRTQAGADAFASRYDIPHRHGSYEALASDTAVDAIYVCTPHPFHKANSLLCLQNGKAVLCEKPLTVNASEAAELIECARQQRLFLMEAMWTRFLPATVKLRELLTQGAIGEVRTVCVDLGFRAAFSPRSRLFARELGGGALLDVGVYVVSFASMVFGGSLPQNISSQAQLGETGVDEQSAYVLAYPNGKLAVLFAAIRTQSPSEALILGSEGRLKVHSPFYRSTRLTLSEYGKPDEIIEVPMEGNGFNYEAAEVMRCMREGHIESTILPHDEMLAVMATLDRIRAPWGMTYPSET